MVGVSAATLDSHRPVLREWSGALPREQDVSGGPYPTNAEVQLIQYASVTLNKRNECWLGRKKKNHKTRSAKQPTSESAA